MRDLKIEIEYKAREIGADYIAYYMKGGVSDEY